jgi:hypothetical protein
MVQGGGGVVEYIMRYYYKGVEFSYAATFVVVSSVALCLFPFFN